MIRPLTGIDLGVPKIGGCCLLEWADDDGHRIVFSFARLGNGMTIHFGCKFQSVRFLKDAINEFCEWLFYAYEWCEMIFGLIGRPSIERLLKKCNFQFLTTRTPFEIYVRLP